MSTEVSQERGVNHSWPFPSVDSRVREGEAQREWGAGSLRSAADLRTECVSAESSAVPVDGLCAHCALHEGIEVGTRPAHICFMGNGFSLETQSLRLTTSQSTFGGVHCEGPFCHLYTGTLIVNSGTSAIHGARLISEGAGDLNAFGRSYLANPDLAERIRLEAPLNEPRPEHFCRNTAAGYADYPALPTRPIRKPAMPSSADHSPLAFLQAALPKLRIISPGRLFRPATSTAA